MQHFVDTRLHVAVRPVLEYRIHEAGASARAALLGDIDRAAAVAALERCVVDTADAEEDSPAQDAELPDLRALSTRVLSDADEYLHGLAMEWVLHLEPLAGSVRRTVRRFEQDLEASRSVAERYRSRDPTTVDVELGREAARISQEMETVLDRLREAPVPVRSRPEALVQSSEALKEAFATAYGSHDTRKLLSEKRAFERGLVDLQRPIASDFVEKLVHILQ